MKSEYRIENSMQIVQELADKGADPSIVNQYSFVLCMLNGGLNQTIPTEIFLEC